MKTHNIKLFGSVFRSTLIQRSAETSGLCRAGSSFQHSHCTKRRGAGLARVFLFGGLLRPPLPRNCLAEKITTGGECNLLGACRNISCLPPQRPSNLPRTFKAPPRHAEHPRLQCSNASRRMGNVQLLF